MDKQMKWYIARPKDDLIIRSIDRGIVRSLNILTDINLNILTDINQNILNKYIYTDFIERLLEQDEGW